MCRSGMQQARKTFDRFACFCMCRYVKLIAGVSLALGLLMVVCNTWGLTTLNRQVLPQATSVARTMLQREVHLMTPPDSLLHWPVIFFPPLDQTSTSGAMQPSVDITCRPLLNEAACPVDGMAQQPDSDQTEHDWYLPQSRLIMPDSVELWWPSAWCFSPKHHMTTWLLLAVSGVKFILSHVTKPSHCQRKTWLL